MPEIGPADVVYHRPSRETWVVAVVEDGRLYWCGWPPGHALLEDCELRKKATPEEALDQLRACAALRPDRRDGWDARKSVAERQLAAMQHASSAEQVLP